MRNEACHCVQGRGYCSHDDCPTGRDGQRDRYGTRGSRVPAMPDDCVATTALISASPAGRSLPRETASVADHYRDAICLGIAGRGAAEFGP